MSQNDRLDVQGVYTRALIAYPHFSTGVCPKGDVYFVSERPPSGIA